MYSQAKQDTFVIHMTNNRIGTYLEIGASHPVNINNTYLLEKNGWSGTSIDNDDQCKSLWDEIRVNELIITDAITFDYRTLNRTYYDYLQLDIEPSENTYKALLQVLKANIEFGIITFETDAYLNDSFVAPSRSALKQSGYLLLVADVQCQFGSFEDWYINEKYIDKDLIKTFA